MTGGLEMEFMGSAHKAKKRYSYMDHAGWPEGERWELIDGGSVRYDADSGN